MKPERGKLIREWVEPQRPPRYTLAKNEVEVWDRAIAACHEANPDIYLPVAIATRFPMSEFERGYHRALKDAVLLNERTPEIVTISIYRSDFEEYIESTDIDWYEVID